jgi:hypothetical protein
VQLARGGVYNRQRWIIRRIGRCKPVGAARGRQSAICKGQSLIAVKAAYKASQQPIRQRYSAIGLDRGWDGDGDAEIKVEAGDGHDATSGLDQAAIKDRMWTAMANSGCNGAQRVI